MQKKHGPAVKNPGALHRALGLKKGEKVSMRTLERSEKKGGRVQIAAVLRDMHRGVKHT